MPNKGKFIIFTMLLFLYLSSMKVLGQKEGHANQVTHLNQLAEESFISGDLFKSINYSNKAYELAEDISFSSGKANSALLLGKNYRKNGNYTSALAYYIEAGNIFKTKDERQKLMNTYSDIGFLHQENASHTAAIQYLKQAYELSEKDNNTEETKTLLESIALSYSNLHQYNEAIIYYKKLLKIHQDEDNKDAQLKALEKLTLFSKLDKNHTNAIKYQRQIVQLHEDKNDGVGIAHSLNELGYLYKLNQDQSKALEQFRQALLLNQSLYDADNNKKINKRHTKYAANAGLAYTNLGDYEKAQIYYEKALKIAEAEHHVSEQAEVYNYMAANSLANGQTFQARKYGHKAEELAKKEKNDHVLVGSYLVLANTYEALEDTKNERKYDAFYSNLKEEVEKKKIQEQRQVLENQMAIEKKENEFKLLLSEKEKHVLSVKQFELEAEKRKKELALKKKELDLLKKNQQLQTSDLKNQRLEKDRIAQLLTITKQRAESEKQKARAEQQKALAEKQTLLTAKERAEKETAKKEREGEKKAREAAENATKLKEQQLQQEKILRKYGVGLIALIGLVLTLVAMGLVVTYRSKNKIEKQHLQISKQKDEIEEQNGEIQEKNKELKASEEELRQNMEELQATQETLELKNTLLVHKNTQITESINYAQNIQRALLPSEEGFNQYFADYFVFFRPKDVVSGDFYWLSKINNQVFTTVIDCTGHGVPGAFMSMIANTLLNEIVNTKRIDSPAEILEHMHTGIFAGLKQEKTGNKDGMDISMCKFVEKENGIVELTFSGAKQVLYVHSEGQINQLKGDRKSIGGIHNQKRHAFTETTVELQQGDMVYMTTDGLPDIPNNRRRSFGRKRFMEFVDNYVQLEGAKQKKILVKAIDDFRQDAPQRDDILVIGLRV